MTTTKTLQSLRKGKARSVPSEDKVIAALPLGKQLAHTDKHIRDQAIASLVAFVSAGSQSEGAGPSYTPLNGAEMMKLWKGLFYCFWMSDKPLVQQRLASDLAGLMLLIQPTSGEKRKDDSDRERFGAALGFLQGFWGTMVREWTGIDRLRMDKFYMLIRRYLNATFRLMAREGWSGESMKSVNGVLGGAGGPLSAGDNRIPASLATHLGDVFLEELDKVLSLPEVDSQPKAPLIPLLQPFFTLLARTPTQIVHNRLMTSLFTPLLDVLASASTTLDERERPTKRRKADEPMYAHIVMRCCLGEQGSESSATPEELRRAVLKAMFDAAAQEGTVESNRRKVYKLWREEGGDDD